MTTIRWFPPSWLLIKTKDKVIYIDPAWIQKNFDDYPKKIIFSRYPDPMDGLPESDMPEADIILITHHHQDHIKTVTINRLTKEDAAIFAPPRCAKLIARPFKAIKPGDERVLDGITIKAVFAYNMPSGTSTRKVHHKGECVGYLLTVNGKTIYHAGDTDLIPEMNGLGEIDIAFLPIGGTFTMDVQEAAKAVFIINPKIVVPMHYLKVKPHDFKEKIESGLKTQVAILDAGETCTL
jgi:L-ascorbate metabolism protein UlaG (beta-lactamase superfamily)